MTTVTFDHKKLGMESSFTFFFINIYFTQVHVNEVCDRWKYEKLIANEQSLSIRRYAEVIVSISCWKNNEKGREWEFMTNNEDFLEHNKKRIQINFWRFNNLFFLCFLKKIFAFWIFCPNYFIWCVIHFLRISYPVCDYFIFLAY